MANPNKDNDGATSMGDITSPGMPTMPTETLAGRETQDATLAKTIVKAVAREMAKAHAQYQALLNDKSAAATPTSLKITSGASGFKVMDPFDWSKDKAIYQ